jgi:enterobactin synthetase component D
MFIPRESPKILTTPYSFSVTWDGPFDVSRLPGHSSLPSTLSGATPKRITEFLAGRFCAVQAIQAFHPNWTGEVGMGADGSPSWPPGWVGSITHTQGFASAAVAPSDVWLSVGIDAATMKEADVLESARGLVMSGEERRLSARLPLPDDQFLLLVFSAKESIYKCLYPLMKTPLEFSMVILDDMNFQSRTFDFHLSEAVEPSLWKPFSAQGRFEFSGDCVHTGLELRAS